MGIPAVEKHAVAVDKKRMVIFFDFEGRRAVGKTVDFATWMRLKKAAGVPA